MIHIEIDDRQIRSFMKSSPKRAEWAMSEALKMAGGHIRKDLKAYIEAGLSGMKPLHPVTVAGKKGKTTPLYNLAKAISFKYGKSKGALRVRIGWIKKGLPVIVKRALYGRKQRVTEKIRSMFHHRGYHLRKTTKMLTTPERPALTTFWNRKEKEIPRYVEKRFFEKFFSKQRANLRF